MNLILTEDELRLLSAPGLSHEARSLYLLFIRPMALNGKAMLDLRALRDQMSVQDSRSPGGYSYRPDDDMLQELLLSSWGRGSYQGEKVPMVSLRTGRPCSSRRQTAR